MALDIVEVNHVNVTVPAAAEEAAQRFYGEALGLAQIPKPAGPNQQRGAWYKQGSLEIHLSIEDGSADSRASKRHLCFLVRDLAQAERTLRAAGVEIIPDRQPVAGWARFYVRDPGGNRLEIAQRENQ